MLIFRLMFLFLEEYRLQSIKIIKKSFLYCPLQHPPIHHLSKTLWFSSCLFKAKQSLHFILHRIYLADTSIQVPQLYQIISPALETFFFFFSLFVCQYVVLFLSESLLCTQVKSIIYQKIEASVNRVNSNRDPKATNSFFENGLDKKVNLLLF